MSEQPREIKCVVWDLDETIWSGILLEGDDVQLRDGVRACIESLDSRGILHSIASRNDPGVAWAKLEELGLAEFFLCPRIGWTAKSSAVRAIVDELNIGVDSVAFVDDDPFERGEVASALPEVLCIDAADVAAMVDRPELTPRFVTQDSRSRRRMYKAEFERGRLAEELPADEFLATLEMVLTISRAEREDLERIHELTVRTNQLNSTGYTYSFEELDRLRSSPDHLMLIAGLDDRFGSYGKVGFVLTDTNGEAWVLKSILMSCRVMSRGVGASLLNEVVRRAQRAGRRLRAEFIRTDRNRFMYLTFKLSGFGEIERSGDLALLERDPDLPVSDPAYVEIRDWA